MARKPKPPTLTNRIRQEVHRRGWTAYRLAKESGLSQSTALRFMHGEHDPTATNLERLFDALGWTVVPASGKKARQ